MLIDNGFTKMVSDSIRPPAKHYKREHRIDFRCFENESDNGHSASIDFVITNENGATMLLEIDENQHRFGYSVSCEVKRVSEVYASLVKKMHQDGLSVVHFVRYNPGPYTLQDTGEKIEEDRTERRAKLLQYLQQCQHDEQDTRLYLDYLYYDRAHASSEKPVICDHPEFDAKLKEVARIVF